jgi:hypothetical protein
MLFAEFDGQQVIALIVVLFIMGRGFQKMFSLIPTDVKGAAKEGIIAKIKRWGK